MRSCIAKHFDRRTMRAVKNAVAAAVVMIGCMVLAGTAHGAILLDENFEGLTLTAGTPSYTDMVAGWTIDNSLMEAESTNLAYNGGTVVNISEWIAEQGGQARNQAMGGPFLTGDNALVFDGDAWDDTVDGDFPTGFNSFWLTDVDLSGADRNTVSIAFSYEFRAEDAQRALVEVSFDGGANYQTLLDLDSTLLADGLLLGDALDFAAGEDFSATSDTLTLRFGKIDTGNDWWFGVDNVLVLDGQVQGDVNQDGVADLLDFEIIRDHIFLTNVGIDNGDLNRDNIVDFGDFRIWKASAFPAAAVPEPATSILIGIGFATVLGLRFRRTS